MSKKSKKEFVVFNAEEEVAFGVALDGSIHVLTNVSETNKPDWVSEKVVLTAKEADLVGQESAHRARMQDQLPCESDTGYEIRVHDDGAVELGCQYYDVKLVTRVVALSRKLAASKKRKR